MDYLDPRKRRQHQAMLILGYVLLGIIILVTVRILIYSAYGYGIGKNGKIIQNGLVFVSSHPNPAQIYLNGQRYNGQTNTRLFLAQGRYTLKLSRTGYKDWQRSITVEGGDVQHFDYPFLFPQNLTTSKLRSYSAAPGVMSQSPDLRWLVVSQGANASDFDLYDLKAPTKAPVTLTLPASLVTKVGSESWQAIEWSTDNQHLLLEHTHDGAPEFIVLDRQDAAQSVNLNKTFNVNPTDVSLSDRKYDQYYLFDSNQHTLQTANLKSPTVTPYLDHVLAYKSYSNDTVLYATDAGAAAGKVAINMQVGTRTYHIRDVVPGSSYPLNLTQYSGNLYVVLGSAGENRLYIYKDPVGQLNNSPKAPAQPFRALLINQAAYVAFSANTQFIAAEAGNSLVVYDIENAKSYNFSLPVGLDAPQSHVSWMDGDRLTYVGGGKQIVIDYDSTNEATLPAMNPAYLPAFAPDYKHVFILAPASGSDQTDLDETALVTPADL